jgi:hypothetical protein
MEEKTTVPCLSKFDIDADSTGGAAAIFFPKLI